jgi:hypothetical protein
LQVELTMDEHNHDHATPATFRIPRLSEADERAIDALVARWSGQAQADAGPAAAMDDERLAQVEKLLGLLRHDALAGEAVPQDLTRRTMQRIADTRQRVRFAQQVRMLAGGADASQGGSRFVWPDLAAVAAIILIGLSLLLPMLGRSQARARQIACANNLAAAGMGLGQYAADYHGVLPRQAVNPGSNWYQVGAPTNADGSVRSNSAHIYLLIRRGYVRPQTMNCPENADAVAAQTLTGAHDWPSAKAVSYSYQNQFAAQPIRVDRAPQLVVLADKNPLFVIEMNGLTFRRNVPTDSPSAMHLRLDGQNVLSISGTVRFTARPLIAGPELASESTATSPDNIWLINGRGVQADYTGTEAPANAEADAFLVP